MRHGPIDPKLFISNRERLRQRLLPNSVVVVNANDVPPTNADGTLPLHPNSDLFYLTGIEQEETVLVLAPDAPDEKMREMLFIREANETLRTWEGYKLSKEDARRISGIEHIHFVPEFDALFHILMCEAENVYLNSNEHRRASIHVESRDARFIRHTQSRYPLHQYRRLARLMNELRPVKSEAELNLIRRAVGITRAGFLRVLKKVKPGINECDIEAEFSHEFIRNRARFAYTPIIASGKNACVLHYVQNDQVCRSGELLLLDVAAAYANYNADLTRTIPVNGRFSRRQREVYDAVLRVLRAMVRAAIPGKVHRDWQNEAEAAMQEELLNLGLLKPRDIKKQKPDRPALKRYFMHGIGHPLGLDVHDVALANAHFEPGWVLTVEPGIYIPEEGFGVRIENDIVVTAGEPIDLMADIPIEADEIEDWMNKGKPRRGQAA